MTYLAYRADMESAASALSEKNIIHARKWTLLGSGPRGNGHPEGVPLISGTTAEDLSLIHICTAGAKRKQKRSTARLPPVPGQRQAKGSDSL